MDSETLGLLEFHQFLDILQGYAQCSLGKEAVLELRPGLDVAAISKKQTLISEVGRYIAENGRLGCSHLQTPDELLDGLAGTGDSLGVDQLLVLRDYLSFMETFKKAVQGDAWPSLARLVGALQIPQLLVGRLRTTFDENGEILESAHPELGKVRRSQERARDQVQRHLDRILKGKKAKFLIPEPFITQRAGRFVIPVRVESQREVPGIVHGTSSSGATVFVEPFSSVELNNELIYFRDREVEIIRQLLRQLTDEARASRSVIRTIIDTTGALDAVFAAGEYARRFDCAIPRIEPEPFLLLKDARHPLLLHTLGREKVVPISVELSREERALVISGPNTGGKTAALKTVGLLCVIAQCGLPVPAVDARLPLLGSLLADIGDHQSITQQLSTFSAHIGRIRELIERYEAPGLLLLDEVGRGTDPVFGAALASAVIEHFRLRGAMVLATTHHRSVKSYASSTGGVRNASVRLDPVTMHPTYAIDYGVAGSSSGLEIARQLGLPAGILDQTREYLDEKELQVESYLAELRSELKAIQLREKDLEEEKRNVEAEKVRLQARFESQEASRQKDFENQLNDWAVDFRQQGDRYLKRVKDRFAAAEVKKQMQQREASLKEAFRRRMKGDKARVESPSSEPSDLKPGDRVFHAFFQKKGEVLSVKGEEVVVEIEGKRVTARISQLRKIERKTVVKKPYDQVVIQVVEDTDPEINLVGKTIDEAEYLLEKYLDRAFISRLKEVRVIHGFGTGRLKAAVSEILRDSTHVARFEVEGGATRVVLKG
ncbi:MAG: Smr/MutS family protein [Acidobacteriota bacterium]|nr:MAG: Smr/MutS family protein [Acidobacteriota bacterium]